MPQRRNHRHDDGGHIAVDHHRRFREGPPEDRQGSKGSIRLSNRTDNESAKIATSKGVVQGYTGVVTVDEKTQIIVDAQAHGTGSAQELLLPALEATAALRHTNTVITADAGYHSAANLKALNEQQINAYVPDKGYRKRDKLYADQCVHTANRPTPSPQQNPGASSLLISSWQTTAHTVFAPLYAARKSQGEWSVEVVLHDA